jgi:hypothetical protein
LFYQYRYIQFLILLSLLFVFGPVLAQNTLDKAGLSAANPATSAYSTRLLSRSYAGKSLQVQRSSDNSTQDIGFTANGDLDTASLLTFVGGGNGLPSAMFPPSIASFPAVMDSFFSIPAPITGTPTRPPTFSVM